MKDNPIMPSALPASPDDLRAIEEICQDYTSGWFTADEERMRRALHPQLAKRAIWHDLQDSTWKLKNLSAEAMFGYTREGGGSALQEFEKTYEVIILDVFRDIAVAKVSSYPYMDYLQLAKINDHWWIVNCLYEIRQGEETQ